MNSRNTDPIAGLTGEDRELALMGIPLNEIEAAKSEIDELRRMVNELRRNFTSAAVVDVSRETVVRLYQDLVHSQVQFDAAKVTESLAQLSTPPKRKCLSFKKSLPCEKKKKERH
jgi:hypothetical protein